jgi:hypothetical protein
MVIPNRTVQSTCKILRTTVTWMKSSRHNSPPDLTKSLSRDARSLSRWYPVPQIGNFAALQQAAQHTADPRRESRTRSAWNPLKVMAIGLALALIIPFVRSLSAIVSVFRDALMGAKPAMIASPDSELGYSELSRTCGPDPIRAISTQEINHPRAA